MSSIKVSLNATILVGSRNKGNPFTGFSTYCLPLLQLAKDVDWEINEILKPCVFAIDGMLQDTFLEKPTRSPEKKAKGCHPTDAPYICRYVDASFSLCLPFYS